MIGHGAAWAKDVQNKCRPGAWLSLLGKAGTGKTHLGMFLWKWAMKRFNWEATEFIPSAVFWPQFVSELRSGEAYERLRDMMRWPLLFLDDAFAERDTTGFSSEQLNTLLGVRVGKWTIITSNLLMEQAAAIEPRIVDRMARERGNHVVQIKTTASWAIRNQSNEYKS